MTAQLCLHLLLSCLSLVLGVVGRPSEIPSFLRKDGARACGSDLCIRDFTVSIHMSRHTAVFGFATPRDIHGPGVLGDDFVANITVPLPYGFAALQGGASEEPSRFHIAIFMGGRVLANGTYDWFHIAQYDELSPDGTSAHAITGPNITLSPLSFWHRDVLSTVFRCTGCMLDGNMVDGKVHLGAVLSEDRPPFIVGRTNETVTMTNATIAPFVMDLKDIVRRDYDDVLNKAGLQM